jgi:hypothetical protein
VILTDAYLQTCKPPAEGRLEVADTRCVGLTFRVTKTGGKSWCYRFRDPRSGKTTRIGIGPYPAVSLAKARERGKELQGIVAGGQNPVTAKRRDRVEAPQRTFGALAEAVHDRARRAQEAQRAC